MITKEFVRVWRASAPLLAALPAEVDAPVHDYHLHDIDVQKINNLEYVTCVSCDWHIDWKQIFEYAVVRGSGTLYVGNEAHADGSNYDEPKKFFKTKVQRGDIIQLWPMASHRLTCRASVAMLSTEADSSGPDHVFKGFRAKERSERHFLDYLKKNRPK